MDWATWGTSWLGSWGNSWGPLHEVYEPPRGGTTHIKLQRIVDAKVYATHTRVSTKVRTVRAVGVRVNPEAPSLGGATTCVSGRSYRRCATLRAYGYAATSVTGGRASRDQNPLPASGGSRLACVGASHTAVAQPLASRAAASVVLRGEPQTTSCARAIGRGRRNLTTAEVVAIARVVDKRR